MQDEKPRKNPAGINIVIAVAAVAFVVFKFFYVDGSVIAKKLTEYSAHEFVMTKYESLGVVETEVTLSDAQKEALVLLFYNAGFRRVLADTVYTSDMTRYDVLVSGTAGELSGTLYNIGITGGKYVSARDMPNDKFGRIYDGRWNEKLDEILAMSD